MMTKLTSLITFPIIIVFLVSILSVYLQSLPLLGSMHYEYSAVQSVILFLSVGIMTIFYLRKYNSLGVLLHIIITKHRFYLLLLILPLVISIFSNVLFQKCPIGEGFLFYLVITIPAYFFGIVVAAFSFSVNKKFSYLIFILITLILLLSSLLEFYLNPQIYFYNPIIGIFPGTIYDEDISIDSTLVKYRLLNVFIFSVILWIILRIVNKKQKLKYFCNFTIGIIVLLLYFTKPFLGFSSTQHSIENVLRESVVTPNYKIVYALTIKEEKKRLILFEHEYYYNLLLKESKLKPSNLITSYIFDSSNQKRKLFGTKAANVAKPWLSQIYLDQFGLSSTLKHELTHIFAAEIGSTIFEITPGFNFALLEGYATALENDAGGYDLDYLVFLGNKSGYKIDLDGLFSKLNFFASAPTVSYIYAGSFIKYLINQYGIDSINKIYQDLDFNLHFNKSLELLTKEYYLYIDSLNYPVNKYTADLYFGRRPLIKKTCPRKAANDIKEAWTEYSKENYDVAKEKFQDIYEYSNSYSALFGIVNTNVNIEKEEESVNLLEQKLKEYEGTSSYSSALLNYANQLVLTDRLTIADSIYSLISEMNTTPRYYNIAMVRKEMISIGTDWIDIYLRGSDIDKYSVLKLLNKEGLFEPSIPLMIELSSKLNENTELFSSYLQSFPNLDEFITSHTAFSLSKYYYEQLIFNKALHFAELSIQKCKESYRISILEAHKNKIEWIIKNKDKILSSTKNNVIN